MAPGDLKLALRLDRIEAKLDIVIEIQAGLKVKAALAGGLSGLLLSALLAAVITFMN